MSSVTIGDQKFIKDPTRGWIDAKTKQPADEGLLKLLNSLAVDEPEQKKLRVKLDRNVEPISINGQKFVYDVNQGWLDDKTKVRAPDSLQKMLNASMAKVREEVSLPSTLGIAAKAGLYKTKEKKSTPKSGTGVLVNRSAANINKPLIAMINQLASIDSYLKQQLQNKQFVARNELAQAKEEAIEAKTTDDQILIEDNLKPDAEPQKSKLAQIGGIAAVTGLIAMQFDPVKESIRQIGEFGSAIADFVGGVAGAINNAFDWLFDYGSAQNVGSENVKDDKPLTEQDKRLIVPAAKPEKKSGITDRARPSAPKTADEVVSETSGYVSNPDVLDNKWRDALNKSPQTSLALPPTSTPPPAPTAPQQKSVKITDAWKNALSKKTPTLLTPTTPAKPNSAKPAGGDAPGAGGKMSQYVGQLFQLGGGITGNAKNLQNWDPKFESQVVSMLKEYVSMGYAPPVLTSGYRYPGDQARISSGYMKAAPGTSRHERGLAADFNSADVSRMRSLGLLSRYGLDQPYPTRDPVHIQQAGAATGGTDPIYSVVGEDGGIVADTLGSTIGNIVETLATGKKLFSKFGKELLNSKEYSARDITLKESKLPNLAKDAALKRASTMVDSRTPMPPIPKPSPTPTANINPDKSSPVIQSPASTQDMSSINYYLTRFGYQPAQSEMVK